MPFPIIVTATIIAPHVTAAAASFSAPATAGIAAATGVVSVLGTGGIMHLRNRKKEEEHEKEKENFKVKEESFNQERKDFDSRFNSLMSKVEGLEEKNEKNHKAILVKNSRITQAHTLLMQYLSIISNQQADPILLAQLTQLLLYPEGGAYPQFMDQNGAFENVSDYYPEVGPSNISSVYQLSSASSSSSFSEETIIEEQNIQPKTRPLRNGDGLLHA